MNMSYPAIETQISSSVSGAGGGIGILNAEAYDDGSRHLHLRSANKRSGKLNQVMPFGLERVTEKTDGHEDEPERGGGRKRLVEQTMNAGDVGGEATKKARGRPKVDKKDGTAADRRRTQIRMAQRAYRHRKETTITSLEQQVQDLRGANEEMSKIFISLFDFAVGKGLLQREPDFGQQLQSATERFLSSTKTSAQEDGQDKQGDEGKRVESEPRRFMERSKLSFKRRQDEESCLAEPTNPWGGYTLLKDDTSEDDMTLDLQQSYEHRGRQSDLG
ncbi:hypothetical protein BUE80_DR001610 [Diplocarpon rosae]|nr:hypothetical protein BUE80_DR001610 [Diplocarpon rosae]